MLDIKFIREHSEKAKKGLQARGVNTNVDDLLVLDEKRRTLLQEAEGLRAEQNRLTEKIKKATEEERPGFIEQGKQLKARLEQASFSLEEVDGHYQSLLRQLPNIPQPGVPEGDESKNVVLRQVGKQPKFDFEPKGHLELGEALEGIDVERASKISGSRFAYLKGDIARLEFALVQLAFQTVQKEGFIPVVPPVMVRAEMMEKMGYVDTEEDFAERYFLEKENMFLVGTAEQAIGPMHAGEIFSADELPKRYAAFSTCFREEAGSYGKDTKGILRVHQFDKVELFSFVHPDKSNEEHELLIGLEEKLWQALEIPYQAVQLAAGDMSRPSSSTVDLEAWMPGQGMYREVSSASNTTDYQARRLNIRFKDSDGGVQFVHMLNATGFAIGRTIIAIMENYQQKDGSIKVPKALQGFMGIKEISKK